jgi:hypothetical protein
MSILSQRQVIKGEVFNILNSLVKKSENEFEMKIYKMRSDNEATLETQE